MFIFCFSKFNTNCITLDFRLILVFILHNNCIITRRSEFELTRGRFNIPLTKRHLFSENIDLHPRCPERLYLRSIKSNNSLKDTNEISYGVIHHVEQCGVFLINKLTYKWKAQSRVINA